MDSILAESGNGTIQSSLFNLVKLRRNAAVLDELDIACSFATLAEEQQLRASTITPAPTTDSSTSSRRRPSAYHTSYNEKPRFGRQRETSSEKEKTSQQLHKVDLDDSSDELSLH